MYIFSKWATNKKIVPHLCMYLIYVLLQMPYVLLFLKINI